MKQILESINALVVRTDFSNDSAWKSVCAAIEEPVGEFKAYVNFVSDPQYDGFTSEQFLSIIPKDSHHTFIFIVDALTISQTEHPILIMDLYDEPGRTFRVIPSETWCIENNLSISNMDFEEFAESVDEDGVFRGFPKS